MSDMCDCCGWGDGRHARNCPVPSVPSVTELLGPKPDPGYLRAVEREKVRRDPRNHPPIYCPAERPAPEEGELDPACERCDCPLSRHGWDGCTTVWGPGMALEPSGRPGVPGRWSTTPQRVCGCREYDPMCSPEDVAAVQRGGGR